ncbi:hypothetical protein DY000_02050132 [Brassica cretica]|uniref:Uncharacterized protein n=1 Tax=Brassica cretica TaxID=69181 RepID=A0ABQ7ESY1_BRACR|nr:hypothetical protein DY000_02050132 [Brassica cretica]
MPTPRMYGTDSKMVTTLSFPVIGRDSSGTMSKERTRDTASSSEWRPKRTQEPRYESRSINHGD